MCDRCQEKQGKHNNNVSEVDRPAHQATVGPQTKRIAYATRYILIYVVLHFHDEHICYRRIYRIFRPSQVVQIDEIEFDQRAASAMMSRLLIAKKVDVEKLQSYVQFCLHSNLDLVNQIELKNGSVLFWTTRHCTYCSWLESTSDQ